MIQDRMVSGSIAGLTGAIVQNIYAVIAKAAGLTGPVYIDYGKIILMLKEYSSPLSNALGVISHFTWDIILGIIFVYLISFSSSRYYLLKGILFGIIVWYFIKTAATMFKIPVVISVEPLTAAFFLVGAILYGVTVALTLKLLSNSRVKI